MKPGHGFGFNTPFAEQLDFFRQKLSDAVAEDRVRVTAADFHDLQRILACTSDAFD